MQNAHAEYSMKVERQSRTLICDDRQYTFYMVGYPWWLIAWSRLYKRFYFDKYVRPAPEEQLNGSR